MNNIEGRLKKIEQQTIKPDSTVCDCTKDGVRFVILTGEETGDGAATPAFCDVCGKPQPEPKKTTFTITTREN